MNSLLNYASIRIVLSDKSVKSWDKVTSDSTV